MKLSYVVLVSGQFDAMDWIDIDKRWHSKFAIFKDGNAIGRRCAPAVGRVSEEFIKQHSTPQSTAGSRDSEGCSQLKIKLMSD